jgi:hypothetical protein
MGRPSPPSQSTLGPAAGHATASSSSRAEKEISMADGLLVTIKLHIKGDTQWLRMSLEDELNLTKVEVDCPILCTTPQKRYHLQESVVVGMRRLMDAAFAQDLISDSPGEWMTVWKSPPIRVVPTPTPLEEDLSQSLNDLESL